MISIENALNIINEETTVLGSEKLDIISCLDRVLAENIYSKDTLPPFNKSAMDGYCIKSQDTSGCSDKDYVKIKVNGAIKAGDYYDEELKSGEVLKIMTGAAVPSGSDAVIQIEKVTVDDGYIKICEYVKPGTNIIKRGEEIKKDDLAIKKGICVKPSHVGLLASLGYSNVRVYRYPVISIIITGDELLGIDEELEMGKIRNSNEYSLKALIKRIGAKCISYGVVNDDKIELKKKILDAFENSDIVITSGGASVGDYDFIDEILEEIRANIKFRSVAIKPGKPITFAKFNDKLLFSLPGNPMSLINLFEEFVKPCINKMTGKGQEVEEFKVALADDFKGKKGRTKYVYANIKKESDGYYAYNIGSQCSNHLMSMSNANGIIIVPSERGTVKAGEVMNGKFIFR